MQYVLTSMDSPRAVLGAKWRLRPGLPPTMTDRLQSMGSGGPSIFHMNYWSDPHSETAACLRAYF